jgi:hypothetical protein
VDAWYQKMNKTTLKEIMKETEILISNFDEEKYLLDSDGYRGERNKWVCAINFLMF